MNVFFLSDENEHLTRDEWTNEKKETISIQHRIHGGYGLINEQFQKDETDIKKNYFIIIWERSKANET